MEGRKDFKIIVLTIVLIGLLLLLFNTERQTIDLSKVDGKNLLIDYYAPTWDPLPHHVKIEVTASAPVAVEVLSSKNIESRELIQIEKNEKTFHVYPGETIKLYLENPDGAKGSVETALWCDSWNYAGAALVAAGLLIMLSSLISLNPGRKEE